MQINIMQNLAMCKQVKYGSIGHISASLLKVKLGAQNTKAVHFWAPFVNVIVWGKGFICLKESKRLSSWGLLVEYAKQASVSVVITFCTSRMYYVIPYKPLHRV